MSVKYFERELLQSQNLVEQCRGVFQLYEQGKLNPDKTRELISAKLLWEYKIRQAGEGNFRRTFMFDEDQDDNEYITPKVRDALLTLVGNDRVGVSVSCHFPLTMRHVDYLYTLDEGPENFDPEKVLADLCEPEKVRRLLGHDKNLNSIDTSTTEAHRMFQRMCGDISPPGQTYIAHLGMSYLEETSTEFYEKIVERSIKQSEIEVTYRCYIGKEGELHYLQGEGPRYHVGY